MQSDPRSETGASAVEYALLVVAITAVLVIVAIAVGELTGGQFEEVCDKWNTQQAVAC